MKKKFINYSSIQWQCIDVRNRGLQRAFLQEDGGPPNEGGPHQKGGPLNKGGPPFNLVIDKGFLDAYISIDHDKGQTAGAPQTGTGSTATQGAPEGGPPQGPPTGAPNYDYKKSAEEYFQGVFDVLKEGGSFILITLAQDYILKEIVRFFLRLPVEINIYCCPSKEEEEKEEGAPTPRLQPFLFCIKKGLGSTGGPEGEKKEEGEGEKATVPRPMCTLAATGGGAPETFPVFELPSE
ncbi:methyltransferase domain containing protein, putative [Eimeria maxima]|uniref:Methyltransferase domain containing protein, putative n=1 Tax=Eimeria maxima TaxID=5804 RepID=U6MBX6_EIMMA|nr:methyltransferase domain containing protein, putative [Eimeria maxima]CDJ60543.1 methyltransferase domain containing protein, putative [Eimeria maxima]